MSEPDSRLQKKRKKYQNYKLTHTTKQLTSGVVFQIEPIKTMEGVVRMHIERVNAQIIRRQIQ